MRRVPEFRTDQEAEEFLETDLSDLDFSQFQLVQFAIGGRAAQIKLRVPAPLLDAVKLRAKARGISHARYIRELMERDIAPPTRGPPQADVPSVRDESGTRPPEGRGPAR